MKVLEYAGESMPVDAPKFDEELLAHSAVDISQSGNIVCHAVVSGYNNDAGETMLTECGIGPIDFEDTITRGSSDGQMCPNCWPKKVVDRD